MIMYCYGIVAHDTVCYLSIIHLVQHVCLSLVYLYFITWPITLHFFLLRLTTSYNCMFSGFFAVLNLLFYKKFANIYWFQFINFFYGRCDSRERRKWISTKQNQNNIVAQQTYAITYIGTYIENNVAEEAAIGHLSKADM